MARNKYPEETVQKILDVSMKLFMEKGFEETTVLDIVNNLGGLTRGAFYHHFKSKEEVLDALGDRMFYDNNPFEKVKKEKGLNGLEKIRQVVRFQHQNQDKQEINMMSLSLVENPKIFTEFFESNQKVIAPLFEELIREGIADGSITGVKYPKAFASFFVLITDIWLVPSIAPGSHEELLEKLYFAKDTFEKMGVPIIDDEMLESTIELIDRIGK
ncbi:hypothetical protein IGI66_002995 [Enterococcus sp. AZ048]|uniref:TetR/AcrR family transcriptional regulator n=1 Tax=Enterococcus sp. AZ048 TaxID=2774658 RepID=UPI003F28B43B